MNRYAIDHSRGRVVLPAADPDQACAKMAKLYGAGRYEPIQLSTNVNPATGVATTPNTMSKKTSKAKEDIGTKVARIIREDKAKKTAEKAASKAAKPSLADRVEKAAAPKPAPKAKAEKAPAAPGKMSGLDAAAEVLRTYKKPMTAKEVVGLMKEDGLWSSDAKTPDATIYAAMLTEIKKKGAASRFAKEGSAFSYHQPEVAA